MLENHQNELTTLQQELTHTHHSLKSNHATGLEEFKQKSGSETKALTESFNIQISQLNSDIVSLHTSHKSKQSSLST